MSQSGIYTSSSSTFSEVPTPSGKNIAFFLNINDGNKLYGMKSDRSVFLVPTGVPPVDIKVSVSATDTTPNYLQPKLVAGTNMGIVLNNPGGNETLTLNSTGEANTSSNVGTGATLANAKVGVDLPFKSLVAGDNITLTPSATEILISATGGGGGFIIPYSAQSLISNNVRYLNWSGTPQTSEEIANFVATRNMTLNGFTIVVTAYGLAGGSTLTIAVSTAGGPFIDTLMSMAFFGLGVSSTASAPVAIATGDRVTLRANMGGGLSPVNLTASLDIS